MLIFKPLEHPKPKLAQHYADSKENAEKSSSWNAAIINAFVSQD